MLKIFLVISVIKTIIVSLLLVGAIILWISSGDTILLPGLGLVISIPLIIILLAAAEILLISSIIFLWRQISKARLQ